MIRTAIVEDNASDARRISAYMERYEAENGTELSVKHFSDGYDIAEKYTAGFDILFLDIEMSLMDGMEAAEKIRTADEQVVIVFITSNPRYAIRGYGVRALDYLLKPVSYESFSYVMRKAIKEAENAGIEVWLPIYTRDGTEKIRISDLLWVESADHRLTFHTDTGARETTVYSLGEIEEKLSPYGFFRCSRWQLINL